MVFRTSPARLYGPQSVAGEVRVDEERDFGGVCPGVERFGEEGGHARQWDDALRRGDENAVHDGDRGALRGEDAFGGVGGRGAGPHCRAGSVASGR